MKSYSNLIEEFTGRQRRELQALFIVHDWTKEYHKTNPYDSIGKEWLNATELTIKIIYDDAFDAVKNRSIAYFSGSDTVEASPEILRRVAEDLEKHTYSPYVKIESSNYYYFSQPSTSSDSNDTRSDMVNIMYFGPAYGITETRNSSTEDIPYGFQFPNSMHFNFGDKEQSSSVTHNSSATSLCQSLEVPSGVSLTESEQKEMFLQFPTMYLPSIDETTPLQAQGSMKKEVPKTSQSDQTNKNDSTSKLQNSSPAIEFFRIAAGFIPPPKDSDIAKRQCTSPFCLCSSVRASFKDEVNEDILDKDDVLEVVQEEPYMEVGNTNYTNLELPELLDVTPESLMILQPFNTPNDKEELETSSESEAYTENVKDAMPGTPNNNPDDKELMLQPFNTPVSLGNISGSSNVNTSLSDSLGVADLGVDENIAKILARGCPVDTDEEYIQQERLRILSSYDNSTLTEEQNSSDEDDDNNFATSTPNYRYSDTSKDKYRKREY